jgi:hypothetical protein
MAPSLTPKARPAAARKCAYPGQIAGVKYWAGRRPAIGGFNNLGLGGNGKANNGPAGAAVAGAAFLIVDPGTVQDQVIAIETHYQLLLRGNGGFTRKLPPNLAGRI